MQYYFIHVLYIWSYDDCKVHAQNLSNMEEQPAEGLDKLDYTIKYDVSLADWTRIRLSLEVLPSRRPISKRRLPDLLFAT